MARKIKLGLKGYFIPQFFDRKYIKRESSPGSNTWIISRNIHTLPMKDYSVYKSVTKVVTEKESNVRRMKVSLPSIMRFLLEKADKQPILAKPVIQQNLTVIKEIAEGKCTVWDDSSDDSIQ